MMNQKQFQPLLRRQRLELSSGVIAVVSMIAITVAAGIRRRSLFPVVGYGQRCCRMIGAVSISQNWSGDEPKRSEHF
jgi:hypothetical protein